MGRSVIVLFALMANREVGDGRLVLDLEQRKLYWTDRSRGEIQRAKMDPPAGFKPESRTDIETLAEGRSEPVGLTLDRADHKLYFTELGGGVFRMSRDGGTPELVSTSGSASGITLARLPKCSHGRGQEAPEIIGERARGARLLKLLRALT